MEAAYEENVCLELNKMSLNEPDEDSENMPSDEIADDAIVNQRTTCIGCPGCVEHWGLGGLEEEASNSDPEHMPTDEIADDAIVNQRSPCIGCPACIEHWGHVGLEEEASNSGINSNDEISSSDYRFLDDSSTEECTEEQIRLGGLLDVYFERLFPFEDIYRWLNYGLVGKFEFREFAYTLVKDDSLMRNISFDSFFEMVNHCREYGPVKIDIGARYNVRPDHNRSILNVRPVERELVFDVDLSDYNDVRTCCMGADICPKCWKFAAIACKILDTSLREDFGWQHILWVFSGRRGIHCWVCDRSARLLTAKQREEIIQFYKLSKEFGERIHLGSGNLYHHIRRSYGIVMPEFESMCVTEQNILGTDYGVEQFLSLLPSGSCHDNVKELFEKQSTSISRWNEFCRYWEYQKKVHSEEWKKCPHLFKEVVLYYTYLRLDSNVTEEKSHLLKAPFSPHPTTHKLCTPFDPTKVDEFDVRDVPTLHEFVNETDNPEISFDMFSNVDVQRHRYEESVKLFKDFADRAGAIIDPVDGGLESND